MEKDDEVKGSGNALEFGGRSIYDGRLGRFVSVDPRWKKYPFMSSYVYAANNPILYIDENGEGPLVTLLRLGLYTPMLISKISNKTIVASVNASGFLGLGVFIGGGGTTSKGVAIDPQGNIGILFTKGAFADFAEGLGGKSFGQGGVKNGNIALGAVISATANVTGSTDESILDLAGDNKQGSAGSPSVQFGEVVAGGVNLGENSFGLSLGVGLGAAVSKLSTDNFLFATTLDDLEAFEDTFNEAVKFAKDNKSVVIPAIVNTGKKQISLNFNVTTKDSDGNESTKSFKAVTFKLDKKNNTIKTSGVKGKSEN